MIIAQFHWKPPCNFGHETCRFKQNSSPFMSSVQRNFHSLVPKYDYKNITEMIWYDMIWYYMIWYMIRYEMIYLTAIGLTPSGSSTVHIYTQTIHRTTQSTQTIHRTTQFTN